MHDNVTHRPREFGFITFETEDSVEDVMHKNFHELCGKLVKVKWAVPKEINTANGYNGIVGPVLNGIPSQLGGVVVDSNSLVSSGVLMDGVFCSKLVDSRGKEINMAGDSDNALVCCVENMVEDRIMDSGIGDVILKTYFGTSWTLKDVRYIPGLNRRLILVGQLDEEGYHWQCQRHVDMSKIGMNMLASKRNVQDIRKVDIYFCKPGGLRKQKKLSFIMSEKTRKLQRSCGRYNANPQFGVAKRLSQIFRAESMGLRAEALKILWADSVITTYLIYRIPYVLIRLRIPEEECGSDEMRYKFRIRRVTRLSKAEIPHLWTRFIEPEITQSPCGSSDTSEGSKNSRSFEDSGRSDTEYSKDGASSKEGGSKTPPVQRSTRESRDSVRISAGKKASQRLWMFKVKEEQNGSKRYTKSSIHLAKNLKVYSWANLVRILISEWSLSLLKILRMKSLATMFTMLVMKDKLKFCVASTGLQVN
nr:RNA-binding protein 1 [Tanacetum cinerariifolium]